MTTHGIRNVAPDWSADLNAASIVGGKKEVWVKADGTIKHVNAGINAANMKARIAARTHGLMFRNSFLKRMDDRNRAAANLKVRLKAKFPEVDDTELDDAVKSVTRSQKKQLPVGRKITTETEGLAVRKVSETLIRQAVVNTYNPDKPSNKFMEMLGDTDPKHFFAANVKWKGRLAEFKNAVVECGNILLQRDAQDDWDL